MTTNPPSETLEQILTRYIPGQILLDQIELKCASLDNPGQMLLAKIHVKCSSVTMSFIKNHNRGCNFALRGNTCHEFHSEFSTDHSVCDSEVSNALKSRLQEPDMDSVELDKTIIICSTRDECEKRRERLPDKLQLRLEPRRNMDTEAEWVNAEMCCHSRNV